MSTVSVHLPDSLQKAMQELAKREGISIDQFIATAVAEKMAALMTETYLEKRARRGSRKKYGAALPQVPDVEPDTHDRLPPRVPHCSTRFHKKWEWLGPAFDSTGLDAVRSGRIDHQGGQGFPWASGAEPPHGVDETDTIEGHPLTLCRFQHDDAYQVVDQRKYGEFFHHPSEVLHCQRLESHGLFEVAQIGPVHQECAVAMPPPLVVGRVCADPRRLTHQLLPDAHRQSGARLTKGRGCEA
jgi:hypothetical protein